ncbi:hypothetical protein MC885_013324, partial [Smutsia gigantea]
MRMDIWAVSHQGPLPMKLLKTVSPPPGCQRVYQRRPRDHLRHCSRSCPPESSPRRLQGTRTMSSRVSFLYLCRVLPQDLGPRLFQKGGISSQYLLGFQFHRHQPVVRRSEIPGNEDLTTGLEEKRKHPVCM